MKYLLIAFLVMQTQSVFACSCEYGEYFYSIEKLEGQALDPELYYQVKFGVIDLKTIHKGKLNPQVEDRAGFMVISLPIPEELRSHVFHFVLESKLTLEPEPNKGLVDKSTFKTAIFQPGSEILELQTRMTPNGNQWFLYCLRLTTRAKSSHPPRIPAKIRVAKTFMFLLSREPKILTPRELQGVFKHGATNNVRSTT